MKESPTVAVIIVTHNTERFIGACLESLYHSTFRDFETILVDNASRDSTLKIVEENYPRVRVIRMNANLGFPRAASVGMRASDADYLVLLNDDTYVKPGWLEELVRCANEHPRAVMVGSKIYFPDGKTLQHAGGLLFPNGNGHHIGFGEIDEGKYDELRAVDYCTGAALLIKREIIAHVGYFYHRFKGYYDETDMAWKARELGYEILYNPRAIITHHASQTYGRSFRYHFIFTCSRLKFVFLNFSISQLVDALLYEIDFLFTPFGRTIRRPLLAAYLAFLPSLPFVLWDRCRNLRNLRRLKRQGKVPASQA